ncbi:MAG: hypothetical protein QXX17_08465 [Conexivisphaerales archaeon]
MGKKIIEIEKAEYPYTCAIVNNQLMGFLDEVEEIRSIELLPVTEGEGRRTYERSIAFLATIALKKVSKEHRLTIMHSIGEALYGEIENISPEITERLRDEFFNLIKENKPIRKYDLTKETAIRKLEKEGRFEIPLSSSPSAEKVLLGIRPEDIQVSLTPSDGSSSAASVYVQEPLGPIQYLSLDMNGLKFLCQTSSDMKISLNQLVYFRFREDKLYFFSADSGVGLYP